MSRPSLVPGLRKAAGRRLQRIHIIYGSSFVAGPLSRTPWTCLVCVQRQPRRSSEGPFVSASQETCNFRICLGANLGFKRGASHKAASLTVPPEPLLTLAARCASFFLSGAGPRWELAGVQFTSSPAKTITACACPGYRANSLHQSTRAPGYRSLSTKDHCVLTLAQSFPFFLSPRLVFVKRTCSLDEPLIAPVRVLPSSWRRSLGPSNPDRTQLYQRRPRFWFVHISRRP